MLDALADDELVFGYTVVFIEIGAQPLLPFVISCFSQRLPRCMGAAEAADIVLSLKVGHAEQPAVNGSDGIEYRDSVLLDAAQKIFWARATVKDRARDAVAQRKKQIVTEGTDEAPLAGSHHHVIVLRRQPMAVQIAEGNDPAVCMDDALGFAGGARGVDDECWFVGRGIAGPDVCAARF